MKNTTHTLIQTKRHQSEQRTLRTARSFPQVDHNFQGSCLSRACGAPAKFHSPAFNEISKDYFAEEAPRGFAVEAAVFATLIATTAFPIINSVQAVAALIHSISLL
jgi:hypothetical protein